MARTRRRRRNSGIFNLFEDLFDDVKDFIDDEILDRGRDTERDLRRAGRNWTDEDYGRDYDDDDDRRGRRSRGRVRGRRRRRDDDLIELRAAIEQITTKVNELAKQSPSRPKATAAA